MEKSNCTKNRSKLFYSFFILLFSLLLLVSASFAWMSMASVLTVSNLELTVCTQNALQIAPDIKGVPGEWGTILDLTEDSKLFGSLRPSTYVAADDKFYTARYDVDETDDGRINAVDIPLTDENGALLEKFSAAAEGQKEEGYLYAIDFWIRTQASDCTVELTAPKERETGIPGGGTYLVAEPVWNDAGRHENKGNGAENAVRLALRVYSDGIKDNLTGIPENTGDKAFIIYEPNADGGKGLSETKSIRGGLLQGDNKLIQQKKSSWEEKSPAEKDSVNYTLGEFITENTDLFKLKSNCPRKLTLYLWVEGQDVDCKNSIADISGKVFGNLQFNGSTGDSHGPVHSYRTNDNAKTTKAEK